ncbi:hypothetical protein ABMA28_010859, partial [Loxostege sticticalis]
EANKILAGSLSDAEPPPRKRRSTSESSQTKKSRLDVVEEKIDNLFSLLKTKINFFNESPSESYRSDDIIDMQTEDEPDLDISSPESEWQAPSLSAGIGAEGDLDDLDFRPETKEADPLIPEPTPELKEEGIACQRFGSEAWCRIRYKDVEKKLHASPVFSALKINTELGSLGSNPSPTFSKQDGMLGTICHGLLLQRRAAVEDFKMIAAKYPVGGEIRKLLSESRFKSLSDDLLQYVCAHRAETIDIRRKMFRAKNEALTAALHQIPPSSTHLFEEKALNGFLRDNGGAGQVFPSKQGAVPEKKHAFRKPSTPAFPQGPKTLRPRQRNTAHSSPRGSTPRGQQNAPKPRRDGSRNKPEKHRPNKKY